jgi:thiol-disulfide isomerase/thioredoxin
MSLHKTTPDRAPLRAFCLCAAWCRTCDEYRATFDAAARDLAGAVRCDWVDIEDDAELLGEIDVVDFPTLLIADAGGVLFLGPLTPQPALLARMLRSALDGALPVLAGSAGEAFLARMAAAGR